MEVLDVPRPVPDATEVLVRTVASVISPGTERAVTALAQASLLAKARARPDLVRQVVKKARAEGLAATRQAVRGRLAEDLPLGYSAAGIVLAAGPAVTGVRPGQLVATGGAGKANHAELQAVPGLLCATVPEGVPAEDAAFTTIASIALHGLRQAEAGPGSKIVVLGLGLIGQLAARLAIAAGCEVAGIDPAEQPRRVAAGSGVLALDECGDVTTDQVLSWSRGRGADAVLVCAAGRSSDAVMRVPALCRDRAAVVIVGDVGLQLSRTPFYERELSLRFARSYGPGRYEPSYEAWGVDFPAGQVRWTEGRNFEAVLDLLASGRLAVSDLVTHTYGIAEADAAYRLIEQRSEPYLAIRLDLPGDSRRRKRPAERFSRRPARHPGSDGPGPGRSPPGRCCPPSAPQASAGSWPSPRPAACPPGGPRSGTASRKRYRAPDALIGDPDVEVIVVATPHDTHADLTAQALAAGRHVWCEKPLALTLDELDAVEKAWRGSGAPARGGLQPPLVSRRAGRTAGPRRVPAPKLVVYRVAAGRVPDGHWYHDRRQGGRLLGEVCHFVDTAQALVGAPVEDVAALPGDAVPGAAHLDDAAVSLRFADGSLAVIAYGSAEPVAGKEWIEVQAASHRVVINDFRSAEVDGKTVWKGRQNKGHYALAVAFRQAVAGTSQLPTEDMLATMQATIRAAAGSSSHD